MQWDKKPDISSFAGTYRIRRGFLFFPRCIEDKYKWLEMASWEEQLDTIVKSWDTGWGSRQYFTYKWVAKHWF